MKKFSLALIAAISMVSFSVVAMEAPQTSIPEEEAPLSTYVDEVNVESTDPTMETEENNVLTDIYEQTDEEEVSCDEQTDEDC